MKAAGLVFPLMLVLVLSPSVSGSATQTDWSGGDGVSGPVTDWGDTFDFEIDIYWSGSSDDLFLDIVTLNEPFEHTVDSEFENVTSVYAEDIDGDGDMDVLGAAGSYDDDIKWWENTDGSGISWTEHTVGSDLDGPNSVYAEDVDGDGDMDVLGAIKYADDIIWWENDNGSGTSWTEHTVDGDFDVAISVYAEDIDGDGDMDVLGAAEEDYAITWWENNNSIGTSWIEHTIDGNFMGARSVYAEDVNGDGDMDVLGAARYADDITWWENDNGSGTSWTEHTVDGSFDSAYSVYAEDVDGDGDMDVLGAAALADDITWWENDNGSGTSWTEHTVDGDFNYACSVYAEDVDGDGDMDVLGAANGAFDITWWENDDGSGTSWTEHTVENDFSYAVSVYAEDINDDGNMDVLGAAYNADDISWWELIGYPPEGSLQSSVLDIQENPYWQTIDWTCSEPSGTGVAFQVRASDNFSNMGPWSDTLTMPCSLDGILTEGDSLFQYKAIFTTSDPGSTPVLGDVTVTWNLEGIEHESGNESYAMSLYGARPNPALGQAFLIFSLSMNSRVELTVFDMTGRIVHSTSDEYESGVNEVLLDGLASGVYMVRMSSRDFTDTHRFVLIE
ncbi:MAG: T9SS type A sorting domain-containing protein [Candidatus Aegiribacteria sp.]|nr:T9SS type A sorting domain-containing protein [Candidatus Aegiribacteria sp.]